MHRFRKSQISGILTLTVFGFAGCSVNQTGRANYALALTKGNIVAYNGEAMVPSPSFTVYKLSKDLQVLTDFSGSIKLEVFTDDRCTKAATGTLTIAENPVSFVSGVATYVNATYGITTKSEEIVYFKGSISGGPSSCSPSVSIIQHFVLGKGLAHFGAPVGWAASLAAVTDKGIVHRVDSDGRFLVAGTSVRPAPGGTKVALWRYLQNGSLDTSFATVGYLRVANPLGLTGASEIESVSDILIDSSNRILILGTVKDASGTRNEIALWRYKADGTIDTTFGGGTGYFAYGNTGITGNATSDDLPKAMQLDSESRIVITGQSTKATGGKEFFVARFDKDGAALDSTFGVSGVFYGNATNGAAGASGANEDDIGNAMRIDSKGNIIVIGQSRLSGTQYELALWRLTSSGVLDTTFGVSGIMIFGSPGAAGGTGANLFDDGRSLAIDKNDRYIISGTSKNALGGKELTIWRYNTTGTLDTTFNNVGYVHLTTSAAGATGALALDIGESIAVDNKYEYYIVGGTSNNANPVTPGTQSAVWRFKFDGSLDTGFNSTGISANSATGAAGSMTAATVRDTGKSLVLDSMGTYTLVGTTLNSTGGNELTIWRFLTAGILAL